MYKNKRKELRTTIGIIQLSYFNFFDSETTCSESPPADFLSNCLVLISLISRLLLRAFRRNASSTLALWCRWYSSYRLIASLTSAGLPSRGPFWNGLKDLRFAIMMSPENKSYSKCQRKFLGYSHGVDCLRFFLCLLLSSFDTVLICLDRQFKKLAFSKLQFKWSTDLNCIC